MTGRSQRPLTPREVECLEWLGRGCTYAAIASEMGIAVATVALHVRGARRKLGAATREQALIIALRRGLIEP
ncbi:MAG TPA: helix-turn-helix transcriptional regulator [Hyphomicrobiaceae bacterium]|jgi:DNA-binding CsgD family transcriptional regulator